MASTDNPHRLIPSVNSILESPAVMKLLQSHPRPLLLQELQLLLEELRARIDTENMSASLTEQAVSKIPQLLSERIDRRLSPSLRRVVNGTGVILHTNIGRAPLDSATASASSRLASGYSTLEFDLTRGRRGHRDQHLEERLTRLTGASAATVCNNNAASLLLILNTLAQGKEVLVSRGELIEIGGSFRLPSIMEKSGALLCEVGTTNKTRLEDYEKAVSEETGLILRVHPSNYRMVGFTARPPLQDLTDLAHRRDLLIVEDIGSGLLFPSPLPVLAGEPTLQEALQAGVDLTCFSGDKLLGGPQAGLIVGQSALIQQIRGNPLMRACRVDKTTYAALEHCLIEYEKSSYQSSLPIFQMIGLEAEEIRRRAELLANTLSAQDLCVEIREGHSLVGGGAVPGRELPTFVLALRSEGVSANQLEEQLRHFQVPVLARIEDDCVLLDLRTVLPGEDEIIARALASS